MPSSAKLTMFFVYSGGAVLVGTIFASVVVARFAESIKPPLMKRLRHAARAAYALASYLFAGGFLASLLVEVLIGRSSQTSRAGGTLTVFQTDSPFLFWALTAFKGVAVLFAFYLASRVSKDPPLD